MKILQIINNLTSGGAEKLLFDFILSLKEQGHDIDLLLLSDVGNVYCDLLKTKGINIFVLGKRNYALSHISRIRRIIKKGGYQIIHTHLFPSQYYSVLACIGLKRTFKLITTEHSTNNKRRGKILLKHIERFIYSKYDSIVCISQDSQKQLSSHLNLDKKINVINNGIVLKNIKDAKKSTDSIFRSDNKHLIMVARFSYPKDHDTVILALKLLKNDIHLIFVGEGELKEKCEVLSRELKLEERIHFLGFRQDVPSLLKASDIVVLSSNWEGLSLSSVEGLASGRPLVATSTIGITEVVEGAGVLFEKSNVKDLAIKINKLFDDKNYYHEVVQKCQERAEQYDISYMSSSYLDLYKS